MKDIIYTIKGFLIYRSLSDCDDVVACLCVSCGKINVPTTRVVCLTFCDLDCFFFYPSFTQFHHFLLPAQLHTLVMLDINELCWRWGAEEMVLAGHKCALWPFSLTGCSMMPWWRAVVGQYLNRTCRKSPSSSSGVILFLVVVPKPPALPPLIPHLSCLMRALAWRAYCITALISI